jgi:glycosyltransferase involved in cell wall biosynthesis
VSAIPEIVVDGETGLLAEAGDAPAIAGHLLSLLGDDARRTTLGAAGLRRAREEYSVERMTDRTLDVYRRAVG